LSFKSERAKKLASCYLEFSRSTKAKSKLNQRILEHKINKFARNIAKERPCAAKLEAINEEIFTKVSKFSDTETKS